MPLFPSCGSSEGIEICIVELYKKVRLTCAEGMSSWAAAKHFNISRRTVEKMLAFSVPPRYRWDKPLGFTFTLSLTGLTISLSCL